MKVIIMSIVLSSLFFSTIQAKQNTSPNLEQLQKQINELQKMVLALQKEKKSTQPEIVKLNETVYEMKSNLEENSKSGFQLAGYASFDWADSQGKTNEFTGVKFAPIFHYQYGQLFQFEGELEIQVDNNGDTVVDLEYAAGTLFLNDYMGLQFGKFMSPIGQFVQNQHPSWINKLPSTPVGFGHDGAAPTSNVGIALRGGLPKVFDTRSNYALFVSNAPVYGKAADGDVIIDATGKTSTNNAAKTFGGRFAVNPVSGMEIGISGALGEVAENIAILPADATYITRDYSTYGFDFMYNLDRFNFKGELVQQKVGENTASTLEGGVWRAWYTQVSYQLASLKLEPVIRYSDYHNPETNRNQLAVGLNYLFANNVIAKIAYEYNRDEDNNAVNSIANDNRVLAQFAFGF